MKNMDKNYIKLIEDEAEARCNEIEMTYARPSIKETIEIILELLEKHGIINDQNFLKKEFVKKYPFFLYILKDNKTFLTLCPACKGKGCDECYGGLIVLSEVD